MYYYYVYYITRSHQPVVRLVSAPTAIEAIKIVTQLPDCLYIEMVLLCRWEPGKEEDKHG